MSFWKDTGMKKAGNIAPVILIGRPSMRLCPSARDKVPYSFLRVLSKYSLFQNTVLRALSFQAPIIVCHESYHHLVQQQLDEIQVRPRVIILEPEYKGSAAAITLAAFYLKNQGERMLILPSDHVLEGEGFETCVYDALDKVEDHIVLLGVKPSRGENGHGYITCAEENGASRKVLRFVEKSNAKSVQQLFKTSNSFWNTGIFLARPRIFLDELKKFEPETHKFCQRAFYAGQEDGSIYLLAGDDFSKILPMSVEHAILEMCQKAYVYEMSVSWNDLGGWPQIIRLKVKSIFRREKRIHHEPRPRKRAS